MRVTDQALEALRARGLNVCEEDGAPAREMPLILIRLTGDAEAGGKDGHDYLRRVTVQADAYAKTRAEARQMADAARDTLTAPPLAFSRVLENEDYDGGARAFRVCARYRALSAVE